MKNTVDHAKSDVISDLRTLVAHSAEIHLPTVEFKVEFSISTIKNTILIHIPNHPLFCDPLDDPHDPYGLFKEFCYCF